MFYDTDHFPFLRPLAQNWQEIQAEMLTLQGDDFVEWPEVALYDGDWSVFPFYRFGKKIVATSLACPRTTQLIETVPGLVTAGFSRMTSGTRIAPHVGYSDGVLRYHLGLTDAEGCGIRVGSDVKSWSPGHAFVFDDTVRHEAWNDGPVDRVILLVDFMRTPDKPLVIRDKVVGGAPQKHLSVKN